MQQLTTVYRPRKEQHPLKVRNDIKRNVVYRDPKTQVDMIATDQPFHKKGAGITRGTGVKLCEKQDKGKVIAISKDFLTEMDLEKYTEEEYKKNKWYIRGKCAIPPNDFVMLFNTRAAIDGKGKVEIFNADIKYRSLPLKDGLKKNNPKGVYAYCILTRVVRAGEFVILKNYGDGRWCLKWGQEPTLKRQAENIARYEEIEQTKSKQVGNKTCPYCATLIPRGGIQAHNFVCPQNRVIA